MNTSELNNNSDTTTRTTGFSTKGIRAWVTAHASDALLVIARQANAATIKAKVDTYADAPLTKYAFKDSITGEPILKRDDLYKTDSDCTEYYAELDELHKTHGFNVQQGYCPALVAKCEKIEAENDLIESFTKATGFPECTDLDDRQELLQLLLGMVASA